VQIREATREVEDAVTVTVDGNIALVYPGDELPSRARADS
jgi:hypothetical protein